MPAHDASDEVARRQSARGWGEDCPAASAPFMPRRPAAYAAMLGDRLLSSQPAATSR